jgi:MFS family permease
MIAEFSCNMPIQASLTRVLVDVFRAGFRLPVVVAALAMVATLPGRTHGLGLITQPLLSDLHLGQVPYAAINLWATLLGAAFCLPCGWLLDRLGSRLVLVLNLLTLGSVVVWMSRVQGDWTVSLPLPFAEGLSAAPVAIMMDLFLLVLLTRGLGQSALSVVSLTLVGHAAGRRPGPAIGVYSALVAVGFMAAFGLVKFVLQEYDTDWRTLWAGIGVVLLAGAPVVWLLLGPPFAAPEADRGSSGPYPSAALEGAADSGSDDLAVDPEAIRALETGVSGSGGAPAKMANLVEVDLFEAELLRKQSASLTLSQALCTPAFWVFALATSLYGLITAGVSLFNQPILAERGFERSVFLTITAVTPLVGLASNLGTGWLATRWPLSRLLGVAMFMLAAALLSFPLVKTLLQVYLYAGALGIAGGMITVLFFAVWRQAYGPAHLGKIQGAAQLLTVIASAFGPLLLAAGKSQTGSYTPMFRYLAVSAGVLGLLALWAQAPEQPNPTSGGVYPRRSDIKGSH